MKATVNRYLEITPTFYGLVEYEKHKKETFGSSILIESGVLFTKMDDEWVQSHKIHISANQIIYFEGKNRDLIIGKMDEQGFRVLRIRKYFDKNEKRPPQLVLEVFDEIIQEMDEREKLKTLLNNLNINLNPN